jgi:hypothetical protein
MRQYEPIWEQLKKLLKAHPNDRAKGVSIIANRAHHPRIVKAVIKEKWSDVGFKAVNHPRIARLSYAQNQSKITFFLELTANSITKEDI